MNVLVRTPEPEPVYEGDHVEFTLSTEDVKVFSHEEAVGILEADHASTAEVNDDQATDDELSITGSGE